MSNETLQSVPEANSTRLLPRSGLTWFELPMADVTRAVSFYQELLAEPLKSDGNDAEPTFIFPKHGGDVTGALTKREHLEPGPSGTLVYLRVEGTLEDARARCEQAGGTLLTPPLTVPGVPGTFCVLRDSEGNHVGIHAQR